VELDCELIRDGLIGQPVNAFSSLAFVVAAIWLVFSRPRSTLRLVGAGGLVLVGIGSIWFHSTGASLIHNAGLVVVVATSSVAIWHTRRFNSGAAIVAVGLMFWWTSRSGGALCDPQSLLQGHALWHVLAATGLSLIFYSAPTRPTGERGT